MVIERMSQPLPYSLEVRVTFWLSHFSSRSQVHDGGCTISLYVLYLFSLYEEHIVRRRITPYFILYHDVLEAICSIEIGYLIGGLWGKPHDFWCAPLTPICTFMLLSCKMIVEANKWMEKHLL